MYNEPSHLHNVSNKMEKIITLYRGSYMSAHVLLNLLNELGKRSNVRLAEHFICFSQQV